MYAVENNQRTEQFHNFLNYSSICSKNTCLFYGQLVTCSRQNKLYIVYFFCFVLYHVYSATCTYYILRHYRVCLINYVNAPFGTEHDNFGSLTKLKLETSSYEFLTLQHVIISFNMILGALKQPSSPRPYGYGGLPDRSGTLVTFYIRFDFKYSTSVKSYREMLN